MDPTNYYGGLSGEQLLSLPQALTQQQQFQTLQAQAQAQQQQFRAQTAMNQARAVAMQRAVTEQTPESYRAYLLTDPDHGEAIKAGLESLTTEQRNAELRHTAAIYGSLASGRPEDALSELDGRIDAGKRAGQDTSSDQRLRDAIASGGDGARQAMTQSGLALAALPGSDKFFEAYKTIGAEGRAAQEEPGKIAGQAAETAKTQAETGAIPADTALKQAQAAEAQASATKDQYITVTQPDGSQKVLRIDGGQGAPAAPPPPAPTSVPSAPATTSPVIPGRVGQQATQAAINAGATPADLSYLGATAMLESGGNPSAANGRSSGLFGFHPDTFAAAGGTDPTNAGNQAVAALNLAKQNASVLTPALGRAPKPSELYLAHQQGATGAVALLTADPNTNAIAALQSAGVGPRMARDAIVNNGGTATMTAGQFVDKWGTRFDNAAKAVGGGQATTPSAPAAQAQDGAQPGSGLSVAYTPDLADGQSGRIEPDTVDYVAQQYILTGQLPPLGMGKVATLNRDAILNRAADIEKETGATGQDAVTRHMAVKAAGTALSAIQRTASQVQASEQTVEHNMNIVLGLAPKGAGPTGSPMLNAPIQYLRKNVWGSGQVAAFDSAIGSVADEYAKVLTSSTGTGGQTSDSARKTAYDRLNGAQTIDQLQKVMTAMRAEMSSRITSLTQQQQSLQDTIRNGGVAPTPAPSATAQIPRPASKADFDRLPSGAVYTAPDGSTRRKP